MADDFLSTLAEFSVHVGMKLMGKIVEPEKPVVEVDKPALANAILDSCVEQASAIVSRLGIAHRLDDRPDDFGFIVGIIAREQMGFLEYLTGLKVSVLEDTTRDVNETCERAVIMLRRGGAA